MKTFINIFLLLTSSAVILSCSPGAMVINSATWTNAAPPMYVTPVQADVEVSPNKIEYYMNVYPSIQVGGLENVIATAVKEALEVNGGGDVIVGLQTQIKYNTDGSIEYISISGWPGKYVNFRSNDQLPMRQETYSNVELNAESIVAKTLKKK